VGPYLLALALIQTAPAQGADSQAAFATPRVEALVRRAQARHAFADTTVGDYQSAFRTRLTVSLGRRRWARIPPWVAEEQTGIIRWQRPDDLQIEMAGRRVRTRDPNAEFRSVFDEPWFVPRAVGDSVRLAGGDFPEQAALHPLAADGPHWYRYELLDSLVMRNPGVEEIRLYRIKVEPRRAGKALVVGYLLLDQGTGDVVRFSFRFVGTELWVVPESESAEDARDARTANKWINRVLSLNADLEYALQEGRHWMPYRQVVSGSVEIPFVSDAVVPFSFTTTFDDYEINTGRPIVFRAPAPEDSVGRAERQAIIDSLAAADTTYWRRNGRDVTGTRGDHGRYEVHIPPLDSLDTFAGWTDSIELDIAGDNTDEARELQGELAGLAEGLPAELTGRRPAMFAIEQIADVFRYNRVQGTSLGFGYRTPFLGLPFTTLFGSARVGLSDERVYGRLALIRDAPQGRWTLAGYRDLAVVDPYLRVGALGNAVNAVFTTHDEADYFLAHGVSLGLESSVGVGVDATFSAKLEDHSSVATTARSAINDLFDDGAFAPNPAVVEGTFVGAGVRLDGRQGGVRWLLGADVLTGASETTARLVGEWRRRFAGKKGTLSLALRGGATTPDPLPQSVLRLGGVATVRGFPYGSRGGEGFWATQLDLTLRRRGLDPMLFLDAGQAGTHEGIFQEEVAVGAGVGLSMLGGLARMTLAFPLTYGGGDPRLDLSFGVR
jgi:hypothetical protein